MRRPASFCLSAVRYQATFCHGKSLRPDFSYQGTLDECYLWHLELGHCDLFLDFMGQNSLFTCIPMEKAFGLYSKAIISGIK